MGNEEERNPDNFYICINMIGKEMQNLIITLKTKRPLNAYMTQSQYRLTIFDFWDYFYYPNLQIKEQINKVFEKFNKMKGRLDLNFRECLIVHINDLNCPQIDYILENVNKINRTQYIPMILFLADNYNENDKTILNLKTKIYSGIISRYNNLDHRMIFFEKY